MLCLGLAIVASRLVFIQAVEAGRFSGLALKQRVRTVETPPPRGAILDREGVEMAFSRAAATVYATPYLVKDKKTTTRRIARVLGLTPRQIGTKLRRRGGFVYLARKVEPEKASAIKKLKIEGIGLLDENKRVYPGGKLGSHVIGFVGTDGVGLSGIELQYEKVLAGKAGKMINEQDPSGYSIPGGMIEISPPVDGEDIKLTIEREIEFKAEAALREAIKDSKASGGSIIVMDPRTGEIFAMANAPSFDPNKFGDAASRALRNRAITDLFEPGSTVKMITAAGVIEQKLAGPKSEFYLTPTIEVGGEEIHEAHDRGAETLSLAQIISQSSNVGAVTLGLKLGRRNLYGYLDAFGLTRGTAVDFPGEARSRVPKPDDWSASTIGNIPFGQGLAVNGLQIAQATAVIANDGLLSRPRFLKEIIGRDGRIRRPTRDLGRKVISKSTARQLIDIMQQVISEGTGKAAAIPGYTVAGKTGTAQKAAPGMGYESGLYVSSFTGFVPAKKPRLVVTVIIDEPKSSIFGGVIAAPAFRKVAEFALYQLKIPPDVE